MARCGGPATCPGMPQVESSSSCKGCILAAIKQRVPLKMHPGLTADCCRVRTLKLPLLLPKSMTMTCLAHAAGKGCWKALRNWHIRDNTVYVQAC